MTHLTLALENRTAQAEREEVVRRTAALLTKVPAKAANSHERSRRIGIGRIGWVAPQPVLVVAVVEGAPCLPPLKDVVIPQSGREGEVSLMAYLKLMQASSKMRTRTQMMAWTKLLPLQSVTTFVRPPDGLALVLSVGLMGLKPGRPGWAPAAAGVLRVALPMGPPTHI
jgi:hypothetical protein